MCEVLWVAVNDILSGEQRWDLTPDSAELPISLSKQASSSLSIPFAPLVLLIVKSDALNLDRPWPVVQVEGSPSSWCSSESALSSRSCRIIPSTSSETFPAAVRAPTPASSASTFPTTLGVGIGDGDGAGGYAILSGEHFWHRIPESVGLASLLSKQAFSSLSIPFGSRFSTTFGRGVDEKVVGIWRVRVVRAGNPLDARQ